MTIAYWKFIITIIHDYSNALLRARDAEFDLGDCTSRLWDRVDIVAAVTNPCLHLCARSFPCNNFVVMC